MTTYTYAQVATRVLRDLGLVDAYEDPDAHDQTWAEGKVSAVISQLRAEGFNLWGLSTDLVPEEFLEPLCMRIALNVGPSFGLFSVADAANGIPVVERSLSYLGSAALRPVASNAAMPSSRGFNFTTGV